MSHCFKENDRSKDVSHTQLNSSIAQEQWDGKQNTCHRSETASAHLPGLSIFDDDVDMTGSSHDRHQHHDRGKSEDRISEHDNRHHHGRHCGSANQPEWHSNNPDSATDGTDPYSPPADGGNYNPSDGTGSGGNSGNDGGSNDGQPDWPRPSDGGTDPAINSTISELTQLSEQLLPVHANGSYPSVSQWESLHSASVQRAQNAAQNGSDLEFFGDSITEAMGYNPAAMQPFNDNFGADKPTALGIGGDGTQQLLYRLNHGEMQGNPNAVVLNIGTNDLGSLSAQQIADNVQKSIESIRLRSPETRVVLMGILPRTDAGDPGNAMVDAANAELSKLATANGAVQFVNLRDSFLDANGNQIPEFYNTDKLHLSSAGYKAWADGLKGTLEKIDSTPLSPSDPGSSDTLTLDTAAIRGVNLSGAEWGKNSSTDTQFWPTPEELDYYKSKGMNTVRLMLSWEQLQPNLNGPLDQNEMNRLHDFLHEADERGMKVLVTGGSFARYTLNHGAYGQGADGETNGTKVGQPGVPVSAMQDFWTRMVSDINSDPSASRAVGGWDLTNEPHTMGGAWPSIATAVDKAIRATGDQHTIVVEGDQWARDFSGLEELARSDKNVAFEAHSYWDDGSGGYANQNPPVNDNVGVDHIRNFVSWLKANDAKGFVGEWGVPTNNPAWAPAVKNFLQYLEDNKIGNLVWAGGPGWQQNYTLSVEPINGQDRTLIDIIVEANR